MSDIVLYENNDGIVTITLNMPDKRNPISEIEMVEAVLEALHRADNEPDARVAILTGNGTVFSSGGNLKKMYPGEGLVDHESHKTRVNYKRGILRLPVAFEALEIPIIAAVNGPAIGAGCDLSLMCDIRIAAKSAKFAESFVKIGIIPGDGGSGLLSRAVGYSKAAEMILTGDAISAEEALACGLVSKVVEDEDLLTAATELAKRISANPNYAVRMAKRLLKTAQTASLNEELELAASMQALANATEDNQEALNAFFEKRKPVFKS